MNILDLIIIGLNILLLFVIGGFFLKKKDLEIDIHNLKIELDKNVLELKTKYYELMKKINSIDTTYYIKILKLEQYLDIYLEQYHEKYVKKSRDKK